MDACDAIIGQIRQSGTNGVRFGRKCVARPCASPPHDTCACDDGPDRPKVSASRQIMTVGGLRVIAEPSTDQLRHMRAQIRMSPRIKQSRKTRVVRHKMQTLPLLVPVPADPLIARCRLQRTGPIVRKNYLIASDLNDAAQAAAGKSLETKLVMLAHQPTPLRNLTGARKADSHLANASRIAFICAHAAYVLNRPPLSSPTQLVVIIVVLKDFI